MFRKINNVFHPNHPGRRGRDGGGGGGGGGGFRSEQDYHNACTVRLVRSTSMLVVGEKTQAAASSTLKRSKSTVSIESTLYYYQRQEDRIWLYSQNQNCLEYLEALVALRRQYTKSVSDLKSSDTKATVSAKKKPAPPPPTKEEPISRAKPSAPPVPSEEDTLQFFDAVIAGCDSEPLRKPYMDDGHADVDFIAALHLQSELRQEVKRSAPDSSGSSPSQEELSRSAMGANTDTTSLEAQAIFLGLLEGGEAQENQDLASSSAEHDLHSNWVLRVPRVADDSKQKAVDDRANESAPKKKNQSGSTSSRLRLQRNPIHLPKVVESAFQTLRFKPKLKKQ